MSKQRRTVDDFVRDMKVKQQHSTSDDIERKTSEGGQSSDKTHNGQQLAYIYFEDEPGRRSARPSYSVRMKHGGSRRISPSCRSC